MTLTESHPTRNSTFFHSSANNFYISGPTEKLCTVLESWNIQLSKTVHTFSVVQMVQKLLGPKDTQPQSQTS